MKSIKIKILLKYIEGTWIRIAKPLKKDYFMIDNVTIFSDKKLNGYVERGNDEQILNCSFAVDSPNYNLHVHEFLHHAKNNFYQHVFSWALIDAEPEPPYLRNVMRVGPLGYELRYRMLAEHYALTYYSQWSNIGDRQYEK